MERLRHRLARRRSIPSARHEIAANAVLLDATGSTRESEEMTKSYHPQKADGSTRPLVSEGSPVSSNLKAQRHKAMRYIVLKHLRKSKSKLEADP